MGKRIKDKRLIILRQYIDRDNLRIETIARRIGVTAKTVYRWIDGTSNVSPLASEPLDRFLAEIEMELSAQRKKEIEKIEVKIEGGGR
jgi:transposase-like protein